MSDTITLEAGEARAAIALLGAEPVAWSVGARELLWSGAPEHWAYHAPILFPVVGASRHGVVRVDGRRYAMPQHGFARTSLFSVVEQGVEQVRLRLATDEQTREHYPFAFQLEVIATLAPATLTLVFEVTNTGSSPLPYSLGFHPAFPWPLDGPSRAAHRVILEVEEEARVPIIAPGGLIGRETREIPLRGRELALDPSLFAEALCFLDARSRSLSFVAPSDAAIEMEVENFRHVAVWTKPTAPFLSLEAWSGHAEAEDFVGELRERSSITLVPPDATTRHEVTLRARLP